MPPALVMIETCVLSICNVDDPQFKVNRVLLNITLLQTHVECVNRAINY